MGGVLTSIKSLCNRIKCLFTNGLNTTRNRSYSLDSAEVEVETNKGYKNNYHLQNKDDFYTKDSFIFKKRTGIQLLTIDNYKEYMSGRTTGESVQNKFFNSNKNLIGVNINNVHYTNNQNNANYVNNNSYFNSAISKNNKNGKSRTNKNLERLYLDNINNFNNLNNYNTYPNDEFKKFRKNLTTSNYKNKIKLEDFNILKVLGKGTFGKVLLVRNKIDNKLYAMKVLKKEKLFKTNQIDHTKTERTILEKINHPFIVKLYYAFQTDEKLYLVTEFMQGGELFFHLKKEKKFNEEKVKIYVSEIVLALEHLHLNSIIYRDLKPENILVDLDGHLKLTDFGLSKFLKNNFNNSNNISPMSKDTINYSCNSAKSEKAFTLCGTPEYLAPEILTGNGYNNSVDWWSLGVLIFEMLLGCPPFKKRKEQRLNLNYYQHPVEIKDKNISENAKNLIFSFLKNNPEERLCDCNLIKSHPFFNSVNWEDIINKKIVLNFVPNNFLQDENDLMFFDKKFTESSVLSDVNNIHFKEVVEENNAMPFKRFKRIYEYDDFKDFSFTREEEVKIGVGTSQC